MYVNVLVTLCQGLTKNTKYEKYIRFFTSFLIMLSLLKPIIDLGQNKDLLDSNFLKNSFQNELSVIMGSEELAVMQKDIREEYNAAYKNQIEIFADNIGLSVVEADIEWDHDGTNLTSCDIVIEHTEDPSIYSKMEYLKRKLNEVYNLKTSNIDISVEE